MSQAKYIASVKISLDEREEQSLIAENYEKIDVDLNKGAKGNYIFLWFKTSPNPADALTRIQVSFRPEMEQGLKNAGFQKIDKDLNKGCGGDYIFLWYFKGSTEHDIPITELKITTNFDETTKQLMQSGWRRSACDLNRGAEGAWIYLWMKQEDALVCDIDVTTDFHKDEALYDAGYLRVEEDLNRGAKGNFVFLWYRLNKAKVCSTKPVTNIDVSLDTNQGLILQQQGYEKVEGDCNCGAVLYTAC